MKALEGYEVPVDWMKDVTIMGDRVHTAKHKDVIRTRLLLRTLVQQKYGVEACEQAKNANALSKLPELYKASASVPNDKDDVYQDDGSTSEDATSSGESEDENEEHCHDDSSDVESDGKLKDEDDA